MMLMVVVLVVVNGDYIGSVSNGVDVGDGVGFFFFVGDVVEVVM